MTTETLIVQSRSGIDAATAERIVHLIQRLRNSGTCEYTPTVRGGIMIARAMIESKCRLGDPIFREICHDVLSPRIGRGKNGDLDPKVVLGEMLKAESLDRLARSGRNKRK